MFHHQSDDATDETPMPLRVEINIPKAIKWLGGGIFAGTVALLAISVLADAGVLPKAAKPNLWGWLVGESLIFVSAAGALHKSGKGEPDYPAVPTNLRATVRGGDFDAQLQQGYLLLELVPPNGSAPSYQESALPARQSLPSLAAAHQQPLTFTPHAPTQAQDRLPVPAPLTAPASLSEAIAHAPTERAELGNDTRRDPGDRPGTEELLNSLYPLEPTPPPSSQETWADAVEADADLWGTPSPLPQGASARVLHRTASAAG